MRHGVRTTMGSTLGALALIAGVLVTSAGAGIGDGRSPDTQDAATRLQTVAVADYRSPDARSAVVVVGADISDGRSPDTVDAATRAHTAAPTHASVADYRSPDARSAVLVVASTSAETSGTLADGSGFDWADAGIGATSGIALTLILVAAAFLLMRRFTGKVAV
jgi:hypothetical protein